MEPGQLTGLSSITSTPAWGSSLGVTAGAPSLLLLQKRKFTTSSALLPLAPYIPQRYGKRLLLMLQQRGLVTLGYLTHVAMDGPRQWLPLAVQLFSRFPPPDLPPHPPDHHLPPRERQFWVLKGTHDTWGGICRLPASHGSPGSALGPLRPTTLPVSRPPGWYTPANTRVPPPLLRAHLQRPRV